MDEGIRIVNVSKSFGGVNALKKINLFIGKSQNHGLLGTNGAGKTTLINIISGAISPDEGQLFYNNINITGLPPYEISRIGIKRTFQKSMLFDSISVEENIMLGLLEDVEFRLSMSRSQVKEKYKDVIINTLDKFNLPHNILKLFPRELPYGTKRIVEIAKITLSNPAVILLDEPTSGLTKEESNQLLDALSLLKEDKTTFIVIEHNLNFLMKLCCCFSFMDGGEIKSSGNKEQLLLEIPELQKLLY